MTIKLGLLGGLGYVSSVEYYKKINDLYREKAGGHQSCDLVLRNLNEGDYRDKLMKDPSGRLCETEILAGFSDLIQAGCNRFAICCNGAHLFEDSINKTLDIEILHIVDSVVEYCRANAIGQVGLIGVMNTIKGDFYQSRLTANHINLILPSEADMQYVNDKIYNELVLNQFAPNTIEGFTQVCERLRNNGAQAVILGCTEIPMLMENITIGDLELLSTTDLHCQYIVNAIT